MNQEYIYKCPKECPIHKHCFVIKLAQPLKEPLPVLYKCCAAKEDILITIGKRPP